MRTPVQIIVSRASAAAVSAVEAAGGKVLTRYYTKPSIKRILQGLSEPGDTLFAAEEEAKAIEGEYPYRLPDPSSRKDIEYYRDPAHRGYLAHTVGENEGPSLFFKVPGVKRARRNVRGKASAVAGENRLW